MEKELKDKVVQIMKLLYDHHGEVVVDVSGEKTFLFLSGVSYEIDTEVIEVLIEAEILEKDGGVNEEEHEEFDFVLTADAQAKIKKILEKPQDTLIAGS